MIVKTSYYVRLDQCTDIHFHTQCPNPSSCAAGTYSANGKNFLVLADLGNGTLGTISTCLPCHAGSYSSSSGSQSCTPCVSGKYSLQSGANTSDACIVCVAGKYSFQSGANTSDACIACEAGKYSLQSGANTSDACIACDSGKYSAQTGASACIACVAGKYYHVLVFPWVLLESCIACVAGKYSLQSGANTSDACIGCVAGKYSLQSGANTSDACIACSPGKYSSNIGASNMNACQDCGAGKYLPTAGASKESDCIACESDTFSAQIASSLTPCVPGSTTPPLPASAAASQAALPAAPADTKHFVVLSATMPYTEEEFEAEAVQTSLKKAVASAAGTVIENVVILSITPARRRSAGVVVEIQILATDAAAVTTLKNSLGSGDTLMKNLNAALAAEGLEHSTGVTAPETGALSCAASGTASVMLISCALSALHFVRI